jgi:sarcosine oxidase subunit gamma
MSEFSITSRSALESRTAISSEGITLEALPEGHVIHVLGKPGEPIEPDLLASLSDGAPFAVRAAAPGQWFIVGNQPKSYLQLESLFAKLRPNAFGIDQSAGRVRILMHGPMVERVLAKGTAVDLAIACFSLGHSTTTLIGHISAHVTRTGVQAFEIMVLRGFAESLWDDLSLMAAEFA